MNGYWRYREWWEARAEGDDDNVEPRREPSNEEQHQDE